MTSFAVFHLQACVFLHHSPFSSLKELLLSPSAQLLCGTLLHMCPPGLLEGLFPCSAVFWVFLHRFLSCCQQPCVRVLHPKRGLLSLIFLLPYTAKLLQRTVHKSSLHFLAFLVAAFIMLSMGLVLSEVLKLVSQRLVVTPSHTW